VALWQAFVGGQLDASALYDAPVGAGSPVAGLNPNIKHQSGEYYGDKPKEDEWAEAKRKADMEAAARGTGRTPEEQRAIDEAYEKARAIEDTAGTYDTFDEYWADLYATGTRPNHPELRDPDKIHYGKKREEHLRDWDATEREFKAEDEAKTLYNEVPTESWEDYQRTGDRPSDTQTSLMGLTRKAIADMTKLDNATLDAIEAMMPEYYDPNTKRWSGALEWYARKVKER